MSRSPPSMREGMRADAPAPLMGSNNISSPRYRDSRQESAGRHAEYCSSRSSTAPLPYRPSPLSSPHVPPSAYPLQPYLYPYHVTQPPVNYAQPPLAPPSWQPYIQQSMYDTQSYHQGGFSIPQSSYVAPTSAEPSQIPKRNITFVSREEQIGEPGRESKRTVYFYDDGQDFKDHYRSFVRFDYRPYIQWVKREKKYGSVKLDERFVEDGEGVLDTRNAPSELTNRLKEEAIKKSGETRILAYTCARSTDEAILETLLGGEFKGEGRQEYNPDKGCTQNIYTLYTIITQIDAIDMQQPEPVIAAKATIRTTYNQQSPRGSQDSYANVPNAYAERTSRRTKTYPDDTSGGREREITKNRSLRSDSESRHPDEPVFPSPKANYKFGDYQSGPGYYRKDKEYVLVEFRRYWPYLFENDTTAYISPDGPIEEGAGLVSKNFGRHIITDLNSIDSEGRYFRVENFPKPEYIDIILDEQDPDEIDLRHPNKGCTVNVYQFYWSKKAEKMCKDAEEKTKSHEPKRKREREKEKEVRRLATGDMSRGLHGKSTGRKSSSHG